MQKITTQSLRGVLSDCLMGVQVGYLFLTKSECIKAENGYLFHTLIFFMAIYMTKSIHSLSWLQYVSNLSTNINFILIPYLKPVNKKTII